MQGFPRLWPLQRIDRHVDGFAREVYLINDQQTGPLIEATQGDILEVTVYNRLPVENTIHWHGWCYNRQFLYAALLSIVQLM